MSPSAAKCDPIVLEEPICETAAARPLVTYTGAVYGALKKKKEDRGADINTGVFMEESNTWAVVCSTHTIKASVSVGHCGVALRSPQTHVCKASFTRLTGRSGNDARV